MKCSHFTTKLKRNWYFPWGGILLLHRSCFGRRERWNVNGEDLQSVLLVLPCNSVPSVESQYIENNGSSGESVSDYKKSLEKVHICCVCAVIWRTLVVWKALVCIIRYMTARFCLLSIYKPPFSFDVYINFNIFSQWKCAATRSMYRGQGKDI